MSNISATELARRLGYRVKVAGLDEIAQGVAQGAQQAGQGIGEGGRAAGQGVQQAGAGAGQAGQGIGQGANQAGTGIRDASGRLVDAASAGIDSAETAAKWAIALAIGVPAVLTLGGLAAFVVVSKRAAETAQKLAPEVLRAAPELLPLLAGPEGAALGAALGALRASRTRPDSPQALRARNVGEYPQLLPGESMVGSWGPGQDVVQVLPVSPAAKWNARQAAEQTERALGLAPGSLVSALDRRG